MCIRDSPLSAINRYPYKIALPAPALYGQFKNLQAAAAIAAALKRMGFDYVCEVAHGADIVSRAIMEKMKEPGVPRPLISSSCPAVVRLKMCIRDRTVAHCMVGSSYQSSTLP